MGALDAADVGLLVAAGAAALCHARDGAVGRAGAQQPAVEAPVQLVDPARIGLCGQAGWAKYREGYTAELIFR